MPNSSLLSSLMNAADSAAACTNSQESECPHESDEVDKDRDASDEYGLVSNSNKQNVHAQLRQIKLFNENDDDNEPNVNPEEDDARILMRAPAKPTVSKQNDHHQKKPCLCLQK